VRRDAVGEAWHDGAVARVASFHLVRWSSAMRAFNALGPGRFAMKRVEGLEFVRVLGTGRGALTTSSVQPERTALFGVWRSSEDLWRFVSERFADVGESQSVREAWHVELHGAGGHGSWRGRAVPEMIASADAQRVASGPIVVLTRANVRLAAWRRFHRAGVAVDEQLHRAPGLRAVVGVGELPVGSLATLSVWESLAAMRDFAVGTEHHRAVVARTRRENWYGEEMFARFVPYRSEGTWDGRDPLRIDH
jgi:heme-degrading monooxygenase HmoA